MDECAPLMMGIIHRYKEMKAMSPAERALVAGAYTRALFGSTYALSVGQGVHLGVV